MDKVIEEKFAEWWKPYYENVNLSVDYESDDILLAVRDAFTQGYNDGVAAGVVSMMDRLGMVMARHGKLVKKPVPDTSKTIAEKMQGANIALRNLGKIIESQKGGGKSGGRKTDKNKRGRKRGDVSV